MPSKVAIIGDHFMLPEVFDEKLREACGDRVTTRIRKDDWPDVPMEHGYATAGMEGLKEYFGTAEDVVDFVGDAEILVTQLAPMSRGMFESLPTLIYARASQAALEDAALAALVIVAIGAIPTILLSGLASKPGQKKARTSLSALRNS